MMRHLAGLVLACAAGWSVSAGAADGLYSADSLIGAPVHESQGERVGRVHDLLLGDTMEVHSLIVRVDNVVGLGGREFVAERGIFRVETVSGESDFDDVAYKVHLTVGADDLDDLPVYDEGWWDRNTDRLVQAWEDTREGSRTAWERAQEAGSSAWDAIREGAQSLGKRLEDVINGDRGTDEQTEGER